MIQANPDSNLLLRSNAHESRVRRDQTLDVVHAHPVYATSFAIPGIPLTQPIMLEAVIALGCVPI